jgi:2-polyprenyl-3-methyl-5-hydroxy-6-metoxy-1,4-benzoquinol methylase
MSDHLIELVQKHKWFHSIDFGTVASSGRFRKGTPQNITLYGVFEFLKALDLSNSSVVDIGTYDGIAAFGSHALGARRVTGVDTFRNPSFVTARQLLGLEDKVEYHTGIQLRNLRDVAPAKSIDICVCAGVIYHMLYPMQAFVEVRKALKDGGLLMMETPFLDDREEAVLLFNGVEVTVNEPYTYFVPTRNALKGMAMLAGFRVLAERVLKSPRRITLLCEASSREQVIADPNTYPFITQMLKRDTCDDEFRFRDLEQGPEVRSSLRITKPIEPYRMIDSNTEIVDFPYHPPKDRPTYGVTRFESDDGNTKKL